MYNVHQTVTSAYSNVAGNLNGLFDKRQRDRVVRNKYTHSVRTMYTQDNREMELFMA